MTDPISHVRPSWLTVDSFNSTQPPGIDDLHRAVDLGPVSGPQFFDEQAPLPPPHFSFDPRPAYAPPDDTHGTAQLHFFGNSTHFANPLVDQIVTPDKNNRTSADNCETGKGPNSDRFDDQRMNESVNNITIPPVDSVGWGFCNIWRMLYPEVNVNRVDLLALSQLTRQPLVLVQQWLDSKTQLHSASSPFLGAGETCSSSMSCLVSSTGGAPEGRTGITVAASRIPGGSHNVASTEADSSQIQQTAPQFPGFDQGLVLVPAHDGAQLMAAVPVGWLASPLVGDSLEMAAWSSRARNSCRPVHDTSCLQRNPDRPLQCTRKCRYTTAAKKDWKRHETNAFPQHGFLCTLPAAIRTENGIFCAYCPAQRLQTNPTVMHMKSEHGLTFESESDMEVMLCKRVCHRKQHMEAHFGKIHPGISPDLWVKLGAFDVKHSAFPKRCGFCQETFTLWDDRIDHIQGHFEKDCLDMREWRDSDGPDDQVHSGDSEKCDDDSSGKNNNRACNRDNSMPGNATALRSGSDQYGQSRSHEGGISSTSGAASGSNPIDPRGSMSRTERARVLFQHHGVPYGHLGDMSPRRDEPRREWRVIRPIRLRVKYKCHVCDAGFSSDRICRGCAHVRCDDCRGSYRSGVLRSEGSSAA